MVTSDLIIDTPDGSLNLTVHLDEEDVVRLIRLFTAKGIKVEEDREGPQLRWEQLLREEEENGILRDGDMEKVMTYSMDNNITYGKARQILLDSGEIQKVKWPS